MKFTPPKLKQAFGYDLEEASNASAQGDMGPSLTIQAHAEDADINVLMRRFGITGQMPVNPRLPEYGDFTDITDFRGALHAVKEAEHQFMQIPADIRMKFQNDPQQFLEFVVNPTNGEELIKMGLRTPPTPLETPPKVEKTT